jgi:hypothetical protein
LNIIGPLKTIAVGIVIERSKGASPWAGFLWRPVNALSGVPDAPAWTKLSDDGDRTTFFAGTADIELYRSEAGNYRENLLAENPLLWVALRRTEGDPPYTLEGVTVDPVEGESWAEISNDLVDTVPLPAAVEGIVAAFVSEHYVQQMFQKRERDRFNPETMARRALSNNKSKP